VGRSQRLPPHVAELDGMVTGGVLRASRESFGRFQKAVQNAIYDDAGDVIGHVDFKNHDLKGGQALSGHGHTFPQPGNPASGHGLGKPHIPNAQLPPGWDSLPPGVQPHTPLGQ
jgi:hypothetical protein